MYFLDSLIILTLLAILLKAFRFFYILLQTGYSINQLLIGAILFSIFLGLLFSPGAFAYKAVLLLLLLVPLLFLALTFLNNFYEKLLYLKELIEELQVATKKGRPLLEALENLEKQAEGILFKVIRKIKVTLNETGSLAKGLDAFPYFFSRNLRETISAAEKHHVLAQVLPHIYEEKRAKFAVLRLLSVALIYPLILLLMLGFYFFIIFPQLLTLHPAFSGASSLVTLSTNTSPNSNSYLKQSHYFLFDLIFSATELFRTHYTLLLSSLFLSFLFVLIKPYLQHFYFFSWLQLQFPFIRKIQYGESAARYTNTLGSLLNARLSFYQSHEAAAQAEPNKYLRTIYQEMNPELLDGVPFEVTIQKISIPKYYKTRLSQASLTSQSGESFLKLGQHLLQNTSQYRLKMTRSIYPISVFLFGLTIGMVLFYFFKMLELLQYYL